MLVRIQQITPPSVPVVSPALARQHTRIDSVADDALLAVYIETATKMAEGYLNRSLITQTIRQTFAHSAPASSYPYAVVPYVLPIGYEYLIGQNRNSIDILYGPVQAIIGVTQANWDGSISTLTASDYQFDDGDDPARLRLQNSLDWQTVSSFSVTYTAGFGDTPAAIPMPIIQAILLTTARAYEQRGDQEDGAVLGIAARSLLDRYRDPTFGIGC